MRRQISLLLIAAVMLCSLSLPAAAADNTAEVSCGDFSDYVVSEISDNLYVNDAGLTGRWLATFNAIFPTHGGGIYGAVRYPIVANPGYWGDSSTTAIAGGDMTLCLADGYKWKADTTYVVQTDLKNASAEGVGTVRFGYMIDARDADGNRCRPYEILEIEPDDEWHTYNFTLHTDNAGDNKSTLHYGYPNHSSLHNPQGTEVQHRIGSFYIAEEVAHDIVIEGDQTVIANDGFALVFTAEVVNQLNMEHSAGSDISWSLLNYDRTEFADDICLSVSEDSKMVTLTVESDDATAGTYYLVAEDNTKGIEGFRKSVRITLSPGSGIYDEEALETAKQELISGDRDRVLRCVDYLLSLPEFEGSIAAYADIDALTELITYDEQTERISTICTAQELVQTINAIAALSLYNSNPLDIELCTATGEFIYDEYLEADRIGEFGGIYDCFLNLAGLEGKLMLHERLEQGYYGGFDEFRESAAKHMFFYTLAYPAVSGIHYVAELFDSCELDMLGIDTSLYHRIRKTDELFAQIAGNLYEDGRQINIIMQEVYHKQLEEERPSSGGGSGGGSSGGGGGSGGSSTDNPVIKVSNGIARTGDTVDIDISLNGNPGIASMLLEISYDRSSMTLKSVEDGGILGDALHSDNLALNPYVLTWANDTVTENIVSNGIIATLTFEISEDAPIGEYPLCVSYEEGSGVFDVNLEPVYFDREAGNISVIDYYFGDVNSDGEVNTLDRAILSRYLAKWVGYNSIHLGAADVNADGNVDTLDRAILARHLSGWTEYACLPYKR